MGSKTTGSRLTMPTQQAGNVPNMMGGGFGPGIDAVINTGDRQPTPGGNPMGALGNLTGSSFAPLPGIPQIPQTQQQLPPQGPAQNPMGQLYGQPTPQPTLNGQPMPNGLGVPQQGATGDLGALLQGLQQRRAGVGSLQGQSAILTRALNRRRY